jgi:hypothetical protein
LKAHRTHRDRQARTLSAAVIALASAPSFAHHSSASFDQQAEITLSGVVTKYEWANPHVYIFLDGVETVSQRHATWEIEGPPPSILKLSGWTPTTLANGERVTVTAHPAREGSRSAALLMAVTKADGTTLSRYGNRDIGPETSYKADKLPGVWLTLINDATGHLFDENLITDPSVWPLTPKGTAAAQSFHEDTDLSGLRCVPYTAPWFMLIADTKEIEQRGATLLIRGEFDGAERTVHLDVATHDGTEPSLQGHSIGRWDGRALVVDTARFIEHRNGTAWSLPSSSRKHLTERFELAADGKSLRYSFVLEDSEYLTRPLTGDAQWVYRPDLAYRAEPCDPANARRFVPH